MTVQLINNETVIRIPASVSFLYLQGFLDYLSVKAILAKSQATDEEIQSLAEEAQQQWWDRQKATFLP